jgi:hypothetical protein
MLIAAYQESFTGLLEPTEMWKIYRDYFTTGVQKGIRRLVVRGLVPAVCENQPWLTYCCHLLA